MLYYLWYHIASNHYSRPQKNSLHEYSITIKSATNLRLYELHISPQHCELVHADPPRWCSSCSNGNLGAGAPDLWGQRESDELTTRCGLVVSVSRPCSHAGAEACSRPREDDASSRRHTCARHRSVQAPRRLQQFRRSGSPPAAHARQPWPRRRGMPQPALGKDPTREVESAASKEGPTFLFFFTEERKWGHGDGNRKTLATRAPCGCRCGEECL